MKTQVIKWDRNMAVRCLAKAQDVDHTAGNDTAGRWADNILAVPEDEHLENDPASTCKENDPANACKGKEPANTCKTKDPMNICKGKDHAKICKGKYTGSSGKGSHCVKTCKEKDPEDVCEKNDIAIDIAKGEWDDFEHTISCAVRKKHK